MILILGRVCHITVVTPLFLSVFWLTSMCSTISARLAMRSFLAFVRKHGRNLRDVIIVGTSDRALNCARNFVSHPELGYRIAGFADHNWEGLAKFQSSEFTLSSGLDCFQQFLRDTVVDEVVIALPFRSMHAQAARIAALCEEQGVTVRVLSSIFDVKTGHASVGELTAISSHNALFEFGGRMANRCQANPGPYDFLYRNYSPFPPHAASGYSY